MDHVSDLEGLLHVERDAREEIAEGVLHRQTDDRREHGRGGQKTRQRFVEHRRDGGGEKDQVESDREDLPEEDRRRAPSPPRDEKIEDEPVEEPHQKNDERDVGSEKQVTQIPAKKDGAKVPLTQQRPVVREEAVEREEGERQKEGNIESRAAGITRRASLLS